MSGFNEQFLYSIIIIALGYVLKRTGLIKERDGEGLARIIFNLTLPALLIVTFNGMVIDYSLFWLIIIAFVFGLVAAVIGIVMFRKQQRDTKGMLAMMVPGFNIGLFAFPLVEGLWGKEGVQYFSMFDVGNAFIVFGVIYFIGSYYSGDGFQINFRTIVSKMSNSVPFMTYIVVLSINLLGLQFPNVILQTAETISVANMPLSLLLLGIYLNFVFDKKYLQLIFKYMAVKYVTGIVVGIALFLWLPFDDMFKFTVLIGLILPTSMSVVPYAVEFKYDTRFVGTVSNITILTSFLLIWLVANFIV
ncbi:AEC family transporter [Oceanobacillus halophilus]|uniref:AEC family transporter n=1 Tax=Oceanobacillus halophilus TaxID=930130 RepID=A0A495A524_9BACI|nr:AEC family transporter [Oceanobacillus halophilus]RKQ34712.1 AEC family transporter [Oceanobacillus halophilus]